MKLHLLSFIPTTLFLLLAIVVMLQFTTICAFGRFDYRGNETDYFALLAIKSQLIDHHPGGVLSSWNDSVHHCSWDGVICGPKHNRVIVLNLYGKGLSGTISPFIGNLSFLRNIKLSNNSLYGSIPPQIGRLFRLRSLYLYNNTLTGEIPGNISGCVNLRNLSVAINNLQGKLPTGIGALSNLKRLFVFENKLSGPLFKVIANLTSLKSIDTSTNAFTGTIPDSVARMTNLTILLLPDNELSGMIPLSIFNFSSLIALELSSNQFRGRISPNIGSTLPQLQFLGLHENYFSGPIPISIQNLTNLFNIQISANSFTGEIPIHFGNLPNLQWLHLYGNNFVGDISFTINTLVNCSKLHFLLLGGNYFTGVIPKVVANLSTNLYYLDIAFNSLSGGIPMGISNLINLKILEMHSNGLTGTIPLDLGKLQKLDTLYLDSNRLTGEIPNSFRNLSYLSDFRVNDNKLQGTIPPSLSSCANLIYLYLENNNFKGSLPNELFGGSAKFIDFHVSNNKLEGPLPVEIGRHIRMVIFYVSGNKLSGEIPEAFGSLSALQHLYLGDNFFHGSIPPSFTSLKSLIELDLSHNNLSGPLPEYFSTFPLTYLNLSYNDFEGRVPTKGVFANASAISVVGNSRLCGGIPELHLPRCVEKEKKKRKMSRALKLTIPIICTIIGILAMATFMWLYLTRRRRNSKSVSSDSLVKEPFLNVSYGMLLKATDGFGSGNLLGSGTFGSVFKGILDGKKIAVKVLNLQQRGGSKSFMAECEALRNIRHRNLVRILTTCSSMDFQRNDFKALVYEFMPNGSLDRWLHEGGNLSLLQRVDIAIDVTHALNYLHHECEDPIVHCDLKPSNILLDNDLVARVSDFGLAKVLGQPLHPNQSSSIGVRGTIGYAAPEYGLGGEASPEADIYSYGILLLELMTRKRPTDNMFKEDFNLHTYAKEALPDQVLQIVESVLTEDVDEEADHSTETRTEVTRQKREECIVSVVKIGVACSNQFPHDRMKISAALSELQAARKMLLNPRQRRYLP